MPVHFLCAAVHTAGHSVFCVDSYTYCCGGSGRNLFFGEDEFSVYDASDGTGADNQCCGTFLFFTRIFFQQPGIRIIIRWYKRLVYPIPLLCGLFLDWNPPAPIWNV